MFEHLISNFNSKLKMLKIFGLVFLAGLIAVSECKKYTGRFPDYVNHRCIRDCPVDTQPMVCEYDWTMELYSTMARACHNCPLNYTDCLREQCIPTDGKIRSIEVINRMLPGPSIQVCQGDTVVVNLENRLRSQRVTSIHWHGQKQKSTPFMDGVGMVTHCPIIPYSSFQYRFTAADAGTHMWHAHSGVQRSAGIFGSLIVRENKNKEIHGKLYDFDLKEHVIIVNEWFNETFQENFGVHMFVGAYPTIFPILINGRGAFDGTPDLDVPLPTFNVKKGYRYRFRYINVGIDHCEFQISIEAHNITVIASDGQPIEPIEVESIASNTGERYDFIVNANAPIARDYWIKVRSDPDCEGENHIMFQRAILRYETEDLETANQQYKSSTPFTANDSISYGLQIRGFPAENSNQPFIRVNDLRYPVGVNEDYFRRIAAKPDKKFYLNYDLIKANDGENNNAVLFSVDEIKNYWDSSVINRIKFQMPTKMPLYNWESLNKENLCTAETRNRICPDFNTTGICTCTHVLEVGLNDLVELVMTDGAFSPNSHPVHLHGHNFAVLMIDQINATDFNATWPLEKEFFENLDQKGFLKRNFNRPPIKDTITMPRGGYGIIRFIADNPGFWLLHCHIESHSDTGMVLIIKVGETKDLPPKPSDMRTDC